MSLNELDEIPINHIFYVLKRYPNKEGLLELTLAQLYGTSYEVSSKREPLKYGAKKNLLVLKIYLLCEVNQACPLNPTSGRLLC